MQRTALPVLSDYPKKKERSMLHPVAKYLNLLPKAEL